MKTLGRITLAASLLLTSAAIFEMPAMANTIVVTPSTMGSWSFDNRDVNGTVGLNPTGSGSMVS
ncbi:MAG TPA: hypothetical protein VG309_07150, partial [Rhizomicrobium sp.]|nr:hypothetical protein [Rhizomicrobium sp.]